MNELRTPTKVIRYVLLKKINWHQALTVFFAGHCKENGCVCVLIKIRTEVGNC